MTTNKIGRGRFLTGLSIGLPAAALGLASLRSSKVNAHAEETEPRFVSITDFGEGVGSGNAGVDTDALENALATGKHVYIPQGSYLISRTLEVSNGGQTLFSDVALANEYNSGTLIWVGCDGPFFRVTGHKVAFHGLAFKAPTLGRGERTLVGISFRRTENADDVDGEIIGCIFEYFDKAVAIAGRGLRVGDNTFAILNTAIVIDDWPGQPNTPEEVVCSSDLQCPPHGLRAFYVYNNRAHSVRTLIVNEGSHATELSGLLVSNNLMDIGEALFRGSLRNSSFAGNVVVHADRTVLSFDECRNVSISGNSIAGSELSQPSYAISFTGVCEDTTITGNTFSSIKRDGILFVADTQGYVTINGNSFHKVGSNTPGIRGAIRFAKDAHDFSIVGNTFKLDTPEVNTVIRIHDSSLQISGFEIVGNSYERSRTIFGPAYSDGGFNNIQD